MSWVENALRRAYKIAALSPDLSTQVGAVAYSYDRQLVGFGCNDFSPGIPVTSERLQRPVKYRYTTHAEVNACIHGLRHGQPHILVCTWAACSDCAKVMVASGILVLVRHAIEDPTGRWRESIEVGDEILRAGGIEIVEHHGPLGANPILMNGKRFEP